MLSVPEPSEAVARLENLSKIYGHHGQVVALDRVNLTIEAGEFLAVVGPSGAGKSSLLHILGLLDRPTTGSYFLNGKLVSNIPEPERAAHRAVEIGFVFQSFHLVEYRSVIQNVKLREMYRPFKLDHQEQRAVDLLEQVGLAHRIHALPKTLSGGERQRVAIARALMGNPSILLADEPTGNLDSQSTLQILDLLSKLHAEKRTIVVITHEQDVAERADKTVSIVEGRLS